MCWWITVGYQMLRQAQHDKRRLFTNQSSPSLERNPCCYPRDFLDHKVLNFVELVNYPLREERQNSGGKSLAFLSAALYITIKWLTFELRPVQLLKRLIGRLTRKKPKMLPLPWRERVGVRVEVLIFQIVFLPPPLCPLPPGEGICDFLRADHWKISL